ncbi:hypothetical protein LCGC14_0389710 [marine sediment metagenome]|uniref:Uncharacterized protein n=1 Tax=marine sediment metagenome TaxID=412755 RepID=A0A0F9T5S2_9ZZZZ
MTAVAGLRGTGDWGTDERPKNFREMILWRSPNGSAPIFALTAKAQKESTDDPEFSWWDEPNDLLRLQVAGAISDTAQQQITVDSSDNSTSAPGSAWGLATHLVAGDLLLVEPTADNATYDHEIIEVLTVVSTTVFTATRGVCGTSAATIVNDAFLLKIGNRFAEGTAEADASTRNPTKYFNYTQIFKTVYELTRTASVTRTRTGDPLRNDKKRKSFDHARDIELAMLFGQKNETTGTNGKPMRTMDGIRKFIPSATTTILTNGWTLETFLDAVSPVFDFDSPAGDTRLAFCGNSALNFFNKQIASASGHTAINLNVSQKEKVFGVNFIEYILPQGRLLLKTHPLLNRHSLYKNSMFILDFSSIRWRPLKGGDTKFQDNIQAKGEDVIRGQWLTEAGIEVRGGGLTNGYIGGFGA